MERFVILKKESAFYGLFPEGKVPITDLFGPTQGKAIGDDTANEFYMCDVSKLSEYQIESIADLISVMSNSPKDEIIGYMKKEMKLPIRAHQVESTSGFGVELKYFT
mgnify:CR=1 FL=1